MLFTVFLNAGLYSCTPEAVTGEINPQACCDGGENIPPPPPPPPTGGDGLGG